MAQFKAHRSIRTRFPTNLVVRIGPATLRCGLCNSDIQAPYQSAYPAACGCNWLWYGSALVATPNRAVQRRRALTGETQ